MKKITILAAVLLLLMFAVPALAGEGCSGEKTAAELAKNEKAEHAKCTADTQVCLNHMAAKFKDRGWVGIEMEYDEESGGLTITGVEPDSPAMRAGLREGDALLAMNGIKFAEENKEAMAAAQEKMNPGRTITYTVDRGGKTQAIDVTLGEIPEAVMAKWIGRHMLDHATVDIAQN